MGFASIRSLCNQWFPPSPRFVEDDISSQHGKVFIVTGGNSGVGYALIKILYGTGATIYMASRSKEKAEKAIKSLLDESPTTRTPGTIKFLPLDLNDLLSVKAAASTFSQQETKLDVLWNNAGAGAYHVKPGEKTAQGLEGIFGTNCVATLLFTTLLVPHLRAATATGCPSRVIWTSSFLAEGASPTNGIDFALLDSGTSDATRNYAVSKAGTWMVGREFAHRYGKEGILSLVINPGNLKGNAYENIPTIVMFLIQPVLHEPKFGAYTALFAGLSPDVGMKHNGGYIIPWGRIRPDEECARRDIIKAMKPEEDGGLGYQKKLWEWCESTWKPYV